MMTENNKYKQIIKLNPEPKISQNRCYRFGFLFLNKMESLEKFIEKRMNQCSFEAMMIPRYLEDPNAFLGKNTKTLIDAENMKNEAKKCKMVLDFLKIYNKEQLKNKRIKAKSLAVTQAER